MRGRTPSRLLPPLAQNLLLSAATIALGLGGAEAVCRALERGRPAPPPVADYITDWSGSEFVTLKSEATGWPPWEDYNSDGLRDREHAVEKPPGVRRVVCLGDSVTLGYGIRPQEAWPQVLQDLLDAQGRRTEVFNVAFGGWSTRQELIAYRRLARRYRPDRVLLGICLNDIPEMQNNLARPPRLVSPSISSALVRTVIGAQRREIHSVEELFRAPESATVREALRLTLADIRTLAAEVRADGGRLSVIVFPFRFQLRADAPAPSAQQELGAFCTAEGLPFLDALPALRDLGEDAFHDYDHFSPAGARRVAEWVAESGVLDLEDEAAPSSERAPGGPGAPRARTPRRREAGPPPCSPAARDGRARARGRGPRARQPGGRAGGGRSRPGRRARRLRARGAGGGRLGAGADSATAPHRPSPLLRRPRRRAAAVRAGAAWALGRIGGAARPASPALVSRLDDEDEGVRWRASEALVTVGPGWRNARPPPHRADLGPPRPGGRGVGPRPAPAAALLRPPASPRAADGRTDVRARAAWALGQVGPAAARRARPRPHDGRSRQRRGGRWMRWAASGPPRWPPPAPRRRPHPAERQHPPARRASAGKIGEAASPAAPAPFAPSPIPAATCAWPRRAPGEGERRRPRPGPPLLVALGDADSAARAAAARALHRLPRDPATDRALGERARTDPDETVRAEARRALKPAGASPR